MSKSSSPSVNADLKTLRISSRDAILDNVKGILVIAFMLVHVLRNMPRSYDLPALFYHSEPILISWWGFNILDLAPIAFYFFIGLVMYPAFERRLKLDGRAAYKGYFMRNAAIMGVFLCLNYGVINVTKDSDPSQWSYFVGIGFTGILALPFLCGFFRRNAWARTVAGALILALYWLFHESLHQLIGVYNQGSHSGAGGGAATSVGFLGILLLITGLADIMRAGYVKYLIATVILYLVGLLFTRVLNIDTVPENSSGYQLFTTTYLIGAFSKVNLLYFLFYTFNKFALKGKAIPILSTIGRNILLYVFFSMILIMLYNLNPFSMKDTTKVGSAIQVVCIVAVYALIAVPLAKRKVLFKL